METAKRYFDQEFKEGAVKLVMDEGRRIKDVAENLGINPQMLSVWKRKYINGGGKEAFPGKGKLMPKDEEIYKLKKELTNTRTERHILKKAVAIFSLQPK